MENNLASTPTSTPRFRPKQRPVFSQMLQSPSPFNSLNVTSATAKYGIKPLSNAVGTRNARPLRLPTEDEFAELGLDCFQPTRANGKLTKTSQSPAPRSTLSTTTTRSTVAATTRSRLAALDQILAAPSPRKPHLRNSNANAASTVTVSGNRPQAAHQATTVLARETAVACEPALSRSAEDPDTFGFGSFSDVFITEQDLERAQEKLGESNVRTNSDIVLEALQKVSTSAVAEDSIVRLTPSTEILFSANAALCSDFLIIGRGRISIADMHITWTGKLISLDNSMSTCETVLQWPVAQWKDVRQKTVSVTAQQDGGQDTKMSEDTDDGEDEQPILLISTDSRLFGRVSLQFQFDFSWQSDECLETVHRIQQESQLPVASQDDTVSDSVQTDSIAQSSSESSFESSKRQLIAEHENTMDAIHREYQEKLAAAQENYATRLAQLEESRLTMHTPVKARIPLLRTVKECGICCDELEQYELEPCGHRICGGCFDRMSAPEGWKCPWDRNPVERSKKLE
ncbi:hypothetical protein BJ741DRAFT_607000 [Chytriomyces cf. hyalinus JEL632]|nr:hypothetical protein BJ741DRAFT_607000 [Chytriomyces cf. hyalinus JEL632]